MPIWLRNFTYTEMKKHFDEINNQSSKSTMEESISNMKSAAKHTQNTPHHTNKQAQVPDFIKDMGNSKVRYSKG